jgi:thioredoxin reductase
VALASGTVDARRILLCTGMIDEVPSIEGFRELWGRSIFQCPYCHGWEVQDRRWGYLVGAADMQMLLPFALMARAWTRHVVVLTGGALEVPDDVRSQLEAAGITVETDPISRLVVRQDRLEAVELATGRTVGCDALFTHPAQRQVELIHSLGLALDDDGFVQADPMKAETSAPGVYAAGDLTTRGQSAIFAAAAGAKAAAAINVELTMELVTAGALPYR